VYRGDRRLEGTQSNVSVRQDVLLSPPWAVCALPGERPLTPTDQTVRRRAVVLKLAPPNIQITYDEAVEPKSRSLASRTRRPVRRRWSPATLAANPDTLVAAARDLPAGCT